MRVVCISDTHNLHEQIDLPEGDLLVHAGDMTRFGMPEEVLAFAAWFGAQPHRFKVVIAGNHDGHLQADPCFGAQTFKRVGATYLQDCGILLGGVTVWGTPWTPSWKGKWYFHKDRGSAELADRWSRIPDAVDVVVTHGPPRGVLDLSSNGSHCGCDLLAARLEHVDYRVHVFGHVHTASGVQGRSVNAAICGTDYDTAANPPRVFDL